MKKIFTLIAAFALMATTASAQWKPSDTDFSIVGTDSVYGQGGLKPIHTADGKTILVWLCHPADGNYKDPNYGYHVYMQTYDKDGNALCGKNGAELVAKPTRSWTTDYGAGVSVDGNIVVTYNDCRNDSNKQSVESYIYCFTPEGTPVWNADGIKIKTAAGDPTHQCEDDQPQLCISGHSIYTKIAHTETYNVKADSTNWTPSWFQTEMPDSVQMSESSYQIMRYHTDGSEAWTEPLVIDASTAWFYPGPDGKVYILYVNKGNGFSARLIDADCNDVWAEPVVVESSTVSGGYYTNEPIVESDGNGGLVLAYRVLLSYTGYIAMNHLTPEGTVYAEQFIPNGTQDGNTDNTAALAVNGDKAFVAWGYKSDAHYLWVNQVDINGDYTWEGDSLLGYGFDQNEMWGCSPVKVVAQNDGWVLLYANSQSYNGANFYVCKIDNSGKEVWRRQVQSDNFKLNSYKTVNDENNAYFFYTCDKDKDENYKELPGPGGLRVMCIALTNGTDGINAATANVKAEKAIYNAQGMKVNDTTAPGLYIIKENGKTTKFFSK